jgi:hypothetical protein
MSRRVYRPARGMTSLLRPRWIACEQVRDVLHAKLAEASAVPEGADPDPGQG